MTRLAELRLVGFKSFVDETVRFAPGLTCIVGPNGCGKSNIIDALRWLLGERSPLALRYERTQGSDALIFAGAGGDSQEEPVRQTPPAESVWVQATFDNADRLLSVAEDAVTIEKSLRREGSASCHINGGPARRREIARIGASRSIVIVGQGDVSAVLTGGPGGRLRAIEDAQGLSTHRLNLRRAAQRLAEGSAKFDGVRAEVSLLERELRSVAQRAARAERYAELRAKRDAIEGELRRRRRQVLALRREELAARRPRLDEDLEAAEREQAKLQNEKSEIEAEIDGIVTSIDEISWTWVRERAEAIAAAIDEGRLDEARAAAADLIHRANAADRRAARGKSRADQAKSLRRRGQRVETKLQAAAARVARLYDAAADVAVELEVVERELSALPEAEPPDVAPADERPTERLVEESKRLRDEIEAFGSVDEGAVAEKKRVAERLALVRDAFEDLVRARTILEQMIRRIRRRCGEILAEELPGIERRFEELLKRLFGPAARGAVREQSSARAAANTAESPGPSDPEGIWTGELVVEVLIPGKMRFPIESISGGEQSLSALAFLLACWPQEQSPIFVLDEVDAALDEANTRNVSALLAELAGRTQIVCVTHNRTTMAHAEALLGVSMDPPGVSHILGVTLREVEDRRLAPAVSARPRRGG